MDTLRNNSSVANITIETQEPDNFDQGASIRRLIATIAFWLIITVGIMGNCLVIVVVKTLSSMRTTTNYLLVSMAVADFNTLLFSAVLFLILTTNTPIRSRSLAAFLCKFILTNTVSIVTLLVTALTLTMLAIERYHALVNPLTLSERLNMDNIVYVIAGIWLLAIALGTPVFAAFDWDSYMRYCSLGEAELSKVNHTYEHLQIGSQYLTLLNCSINPFIYAFQSSSYRRAFKVIIKKMLCRDVSYELSELLEMRTRTFVFEACDAFEVCDKLFRF
ncbi:galanin receptor type 1-like [Stylophora pistillata]|uniref:galanin receptor type 1-like n=1 Tax=Stylophora pistillata TaxID=50429 RepID=UPI000C056945|nr:galanin receptor type 1-like [Stylophora pistillata]